MDSNEVKILFVDDEEVIRKALSRELKLEGYSVTPAANGNEAIMLLENNSYDIVITDLMMPDTDGLAVLRAAKQLAPITSVIILTGYGDLRTAITALRLGADDFTLKPCDIEELLFRIRRCLKKRNLLQMLSQQNKQLEEEIERRLASEERLRESEELFRMALDVSSNGVWDHDLVARKIYFGGNWYRTLGYEAKPETDDESAFENLLHPEDRNRVLEIRDAYVRGKSLSFEVEYRLRNSADDWTWVLSRGQAVARDGEGRVLRMIGTLTDITRLKEVENELLMSQLALEERVRSRTVELEETNIALKIILEKRENDRQVLENQIASNVKKVIEPFLEKLKLSRLTAEQSVLVDILHTNINELTSPYTDAISHKMALLTPMEVQIANLVKHGKRTKEIAGILHLSPGTINIHRKNIRKKLNLTNQKINLQSMLSLQS